MYYLIWSDYDGCYIEKCSQITNLVTKLLEIARKYENKLYGTQILAIVEGGEVDFDYVVDEINDTETISIRGELILSYRSAKITCPFCGNEQPQKISVVNTIDEYEHSTLHRYECPECGKFFYI